MTEKAALRLLIVDDEDAMRMVVKRALRGFAMEVPEVDVEVSLDIDEADCGETALEKIDARPPDLMLLDIKMPGISGLEVLDRVRNTHPDLMVVMITAHASIQTAVSATKQGAYEFLAKPFTPEELRSALRKAVRHLTLTRQARRLAEGRRRVRFEFISVLAHELKAPLNAIEGNMQILEMDYVREDPERFQSVVDRSKTRIAGMRKLILDLLDMTRVESGQRKREIAEMDVRKTAEAAVEAVQHEATQRDIAVELHAPGQVPFHGDPSEIEIILNNLVSNAVKYNRDGGRADVTLERDDDLLLIRVQDTGIGMTSQEAAKLFNDFVRIKNKKTQNILGSGLGLSVVRKLTELYDGEARVESEPDVGSTFTVTLKDQASAAADETSSAATESAS